MNGLEDVCVAAVNTCRFRNESIGPTWSGQIIGTSSVLNYDRSSYSLRNICRDLEKYVIVEVEDIKRNGIPLFLICMPFYESPAIEALKKMAAGVYNKCNDTKMYEVTSGNEIAETHPQIWWDIDNGMIWTFGKDEALKIYISLKETRKLMIKGGKQ